MIVVYLETGNPIRLSDQEKTGRKYTYVSVWFPCVCQRIHTNFACVWVSICGFAGNVCVDEKIRGDRFYLCLSDVVKIGVDQTKETQVSSNN